MSQGGLSLSVLVPVYNEQYLVARSLSRLRQLAHCDFISHLEVIVVDDGSNDNTPKVLADFERREAAHGVPKEERKISWTFLRHGRNAGKGAAVRTALARATGDVTVIHDADLEYDPVDLLRIAKAFLENNADAVFGSRFAGGEVRRVLLFWHQVANKALTLICNLVSNLNLTDLWTCYKAVRTPLLRSIPLYSNGFGIEPELTIKLAKRRARIFEVPISYHGRSYEEGKKIGWKDAFVAVWGIVRFSMSDQIFLEDQYGSQILARLARARRFNAWMADAIRAFCGERILEIGGGLGNLTLSLIPRNEYTVSDVNPFYLLTLESLCGPRPYLKACYCDVTDRGSFPRNHSGYDTVICLNVLEHVADDRSALLNIKSALCRSGRVILLVPQGPWNFGTLDKALGHRRRYTVASLERLAADCGMKIDHLIEFDRLGTLAWLLNGKVLRRRTFGLVQIWMLNVLTPLMRVLEKVIPLPGLSLIAVLEPLTNGGPMENFEASANIRDASHTLNAPRQETTPGTSQ